VETELTKRSISLESRTDGQRSELLHTSAVNCEHRVTISIADISHVIGGLVMIRIGQE
jgi:hypothetical protein